MPLPYRNFESSSILLSHHDVLQEAGLKQNLKAAFKPCRSHWNFKFQMLPRSVITRFKSSDVFLFCLEICLCIASREGEGGRLVGDRGYKSGGDEGHRAALPSRCPHTSIEPDECDWNCLAARISQRPAYFRSNTIAGMAACIHFSTLLLLRPQNYS